MARTKRNQRIHIDTVDNTIDRLQNLSAKPQLELTLRETIAKMEVHLRGAIKKGYSYEDLSEILAEQEIMVSAATLKLYLTQSSKSKKSSSSRIKKSKSSSASTSRSTRQSKDNLSTNVTDSKEELESGKKKAEINSMKDSIDLKQAVNLNSKTRTKSSSSIGNKAETKSQSIGNKSNSTKTPVLSGSNDDLSREFNDF